MDGQRARLVARTLDRVPTIRRAAPVTARWAPGRLTPTWAAILGFGWPLAILVGDALTPPPANPEAAEPLIASLAVLALFTVLVATAAAAGNRHPSAAGLGVVTGLISVACGAACPASGHHAIGPWWFGQMGLTLVMLAVSVAALGGRAREAA
ncbi:MAG TPA: hypothetical protein VFG94_00360 [Acidimicrobiales bacterium]|jgi:hypothetical protein|nr:hypothetical protein [Acidimicrobiales bacterium]